MHLQISNHIPGQVGVFETHEGTYVNLNDEDTRVLSLVEVNPFTGVSLQVIEKPPQQQPNSGNKLLLPCKFDTLRLEGHSNKVRLSGINSEIYTISVDGSNNLVIFTDDTNVGCVRWEESGGGNTLDVSQQENTQTSGTFSPTTNVITKLTVLPSCKICHGEERANVLLLPCGHLGLCHRCSKKMFQPNTQRSCPFCRAPCTPSILYLA
jgi:hypothetical protein